MAAILNMKKKHSRSYYILVPLLALIFVLILIFMQHSTKQHKVTAEKSNCFACFTCSCVITIDNINYTYSGIEKDGTIKCFERINKDEWRYNKEAILMLDDNEFLIFENCLKSELK